MASILSREERRTRFFRPPPGAKPPAPRTGQPRHAKGARESPDSKPRSAIAALADVDADTPGKK
jgi:hypothetical protein